MIYIGFKDTIILDNINLINNINININTKATTAIAINNIKYINNIIILTISKSKTINYTRIY